MTKFTIEELNEILNLMDVATKAGGLQVAQKALPIVAKMQVMAAEIENPEAVETNEGHA